MPIGQRQRGTAQGPPITPRGIPRGANVAQVLGDAAPGESAPSSYAGDAISDAFGTGTLVIPNTGQPVLMLDADLARTSVLINNNHATVAVRVTGSPTTQATSGFELRPGQSLSIPTRGQVYVAVLNTEPASGTVQWVVERFAA